MSNAFEAKDVILTREKKGTMYDIAPMTNSNMVYTDPKTTLTETLKGINNSLDDCVVKEEGKGLSSNDFDDTLKDKLENDYTKNEIDELTSLLSDMIPHVKEI